MNIYIVTDGCYSDYSIVKCFSNPEAAEEYREWHHISNPVEVYEIFDNPMFEDFEQKYYVVYLTANVLVDNHVIINKIDVEKRIYCNLMNTTGFSLQKDPIKYHFRMARCFTPENFDEERCVERVKKAAYDIIGQINYMMEEGATVADIDEALINITRKGDN